MFGTIPEFVANFVVNTLKRGEQVQKEEEVHMLASMVMSSVNQMFQAIVASCSYQLRCGRFIDMETVGET